ncbi:MAG: CHASE2 domain-containing protein, partial [Alphaproteobacteria bacterium]
DAILPALFVEILRVATDQTTYGVRVGGAGVEGLIVAGVLVPTDATGSVWIRFAHHDAQRFVSAVDVLEGRVDDARFAGKLVLFGTSAAGLGEVRATPLSTFMPGVEIQAQLIETVLSKSYLTRPSYAAGLELSVAFVAGMLLIVLVPVIGARWTLGLLVMVVLVLVAASWHLFADRALLVDSSYPVGAVTIVYLTLAYAGFAVEERQKKQVSDAFRHYLSPVLVERLAREPERLQLGGELRTTTIMFADIRGFTTLSERFKDDPQGLTRLINRFLTPMTEVVLNHGGTIDKYIGDCLMAFWNAPVADPRHGEHACRAALDMVGALEGLNRELKSEFLRARAQPRTDVPSHAAPEHDGVRGEQRSDAPIGALVLESSYGIAASQYRLGKAYRDGVHGRPDPGQAAKWFEAAAAQGHAKAQRLIGLKYAQGEGVPHDDVAALSWLILAAQQGLPAANAARQSLAATMDGARVAAAETRAAAWRPKQSSELLIRLGMGIGLNTGECVVGNMGSDHRFNYSAIGDSVNLASRLEAQCANYGARIIASEATIALAPNFAALELDLIVVKGKTEPVRIFALLGPPEMTEAASFRSWAECHRALIESYRRQGWAEARAWLERSAQQGELLESVYDLYRARIEHYESEPPGPGWDGVFVALRK